MIQTGDPTGTGKGGQSIWGKPFQDEIRSTLKVLRYLHSPSSPERRRDPHPWLVLAFMLIIPTHSSTPVVSLQWRTPDLTPTSRNSSSHMLNSLTLIQNIPSLARS